MLPMKAPIHSKTHQTARSAQAGVSGGATATDSFVDRRPYATAQRKLAHLAGDSFQSQQHQNLSDLMDNSPRTVAQAQMITGGAPLQLAAKTAQTAPAKPNNTGLADQLKNGVESLSGMSLDHVKVHYNSPQPAQLNAHAYAQGSDIYIAPGQEQHLPHETWHVVQQAQGRVPTTLQLAGVNVNNNAALEAEADAMGARALHQTSGNIQRKESTAHSTGCCCGTCGGAPLQRMAKPSTNAVAQLTLSIDIQNANGDTKTGTSGNEASARSGIARYPKLQSEFNRVATPEHIAATPKNDAYDRNGYMCAEPHALGLMLHHYDIHDMPLLPGDLATFTFPRLAINNDDQQRIPPCPVCAKWLTAAAPLAIQNLAPTDMRSKRQIDKAQEDEYAEQLKREELASLQKDKEEKKVEAKTARTLTEEREKTISDIVSTHGAIFLELYSKLTFQLTKKKPTDGDKKEFVEAKLREWIAIYDKNDSRSHQVLVRHFVGDFCNEFVQWANK
jgi:hypothetical protein